MVIPFFSLLVKDLYFENEGCATLIPTNGHLNFEKFDRLGQRLSEFALWLELRKIHLDVFNILRFSK